MDKKRRILWIDDEITELQSHIRFLEHNGYIITTAAGDSEGLSILETGFYDAVLLDHKMPEIDGIRVLSKIKKSHPHLPVVIVTGSDQDHALSAAIVHHVDDFLIKPVSPKQIASVLSYVFDHSAMEQDHTAQEYVVDFNKRRFLEQQQVVDWRTWIDCYVQMVEWDLRLDELAAADDLRETHLLEKQECQSLFARYVEDHYCDWLVGKDSPVLSVDVIYKHVLPEVQVGKQVLFVVLDCMRLDHWFTIKPLLQPYFDVTTNFYYSILPTATSYARNAIFSGLFPLELAERHPNLWIEIDEDNTSINRHEKKLMCMQLERHGIVLKPSPQYFKIFDVRGEMEYLQWVNSVPRISLAALVVDFIDILTHKRSEMSWLKQLIPHEAAFRSVVRGWFQHSGLFKILKLLADRGVTVVLTSDHGSILSERPARVSSSQAATNGLRFKLGAEIHVNDEVGLRITDPKRYKLPNDSAQKNYVLAKEGYYFVYATQFNDYKDQFGGGFQHGGISMEEMILPCVVLDPR